MAFYPKLLTCADLGLVNNIRSSRLLIYPHYNDAFTTRERAMSSELG